MSEASRAHAPQSAVVLAFGATDDALGDALEASRRAINTHPIAAQAIFSALAAEGRRYAMTEEGRALVARLASSPWIERVRMVWETVSVTS